MSLEHRVIIGEGEQKYLISKEEGCILSSPAGKKGKREEKIKRGIGGPWGWRGVLKGSFFGSAIRPVSTIWNGIQYSAYRKIDSFKDSQTPTIKKISRQEAQTN